MYICVYTYIYIYIYIYAEAPEDRGRPSLPAEVFPAKIP